MIDNQRSTENVPFLSSPWRELTFVAFDTETTGRYPLSAEVCELAAVKWRGGQVVDTFQTLLRPARPMVAENIAIHGITNEMVEGAPFMHDKVAEFHTFIQGAVTVAHHAPFDLGFMALEFEKAGLPLPEEPALCSSLLARKLFPESDNHRLQTLVGFFDLQKGTAHRALDDAKACLEVGIRCCEKMGDVTLRRIMEEQGGPITWERFSMNVVDQTSTGRTLIQAIKEQWIVEMAYEGGSKPGEKRRVHPEGLVRSLDGDFVVAYAEKDQRSKRYLLDKILSVERVGLT